jgi:hypothetical protein
MSDSLRSAACLGCGAEFLACSASCFEQYGHYIELLE